VQIGKIGKIVTGKTPKTDKIEYYGDDFMFIGPTDLHNHFIIRKSQKMITESGLLSIKGSRLKGTSILVGCIGWDMGNVAITENE
ncbi:restriction endonuclease subunit S, partial [Burkholderia sp. SIMBA_013]